MKNKLKNALVSVIGISMVLLALASCGDDPQPDNATVEVPSGKSPNASVSGTVTYRERLALRKAILPGANCGSYPVCPAVAAPGSTAMKSGERYQPI